MSNNKKKKNSLNKVGILKLMNLRNLKLEMNRCGTEFSIKKFIKFILMCYAGLAAFSYVFKLEFTYIAVVIFAATILMPSIFLLQYRNIYEQKKFEDVNAYIEQLLYSFKRQPKILTALQDTALLFQGDKNSQIREAIENAIDHIQTGSAETNIYREAFAYIEEEYGCKRLYKVHNFLIKVEGTGGDCDEAIEILLLDRNLWLNRIYALIQDKQKIKVNITIAIALSLLICGMSIYMVPDDFGISAIAASQIVTTAVLLTDLFLWYFVQVKMTVGLLKADADAPFSDISRAYETIMHGNLKKEQKKYTVTAAIFLIGAGISYFCIGVKAGVIILACAYIIWTQPGRKYKACMKRTKREVEKAFPEWLLSLSLQMQTDNVHVSIAKTIDDSPEILQEELYALQDNLERYPNQLEPYLKFMDRFEIPDITSAMKMLYAMAEFGAENAQEQIRTLVDRNTSMMDRSEKMRMEDSLAGMEMTLLLPMITGVLKMITDLALVMGFILSKINTV